MNIAHREGSFAPSHIGLDLTSGSDRRQVPVLAHDATTSGVPSQTPALRHFPMPATVTVGAASQSASEPTLSRAEPRVPTSSYSYEISKRAFDVVTALVLLILLAPLMLAIAIVIRATTTGPVFYRQVRCGRNGMPFVCFKFRSMIANADALQCTLTSLNELSGPVFKMHHDPRVTTVGHWLRKFSLDELPQLWNVFRGEMSLVGPRPPLPSEVAMYESWQLRRLDVTPGLTCLWQVSGRSDVSFDRWVELDLEYIRRRSFAFDVWLVLLTIPAVITGRGAC